MKLLLKGTNNPDMNDNEKFKYNANFEAPQHKIKIHTVKAKETGVENDMTQKVVMLNRQHQVYYYKYNYRLMH